MRVQILTLDEVTVADAHAWRALAREASAPNVWLDPRFVLPAIDWPGMVDGMRLIAVTDEGGWQGLLPVEVQRPIRSVPLTVATAHGRFMTWHSDRRHPLIRAGRVAEVLPMLVDAACSLSSSRTVRIGELPAEGEWWEAVQPGQPGRAVTSDGRGLAFTTSNEPRSEEPPLSPAQIVSESTQLKARSRNRIATYLRGLAAHVSTELTVADRTDEPGVLDEFIALQGSGWKGDPARGGAGLVLDDDYARWFREVVRGFGADGDVSVLTLEAGGVTMAMHIALRAGTTWILFVDTYDERFQEFGPGSALRVIASTLLTWDGSHTYDSGVTVPHGQSPRGFGSVAPVVDASFASGLMSGAARALLSTAEGLRDQRDGHRGTGRRRDH